MNCLNSEGQDLSVFKKPFCFSFGFKNANNISTSDCAPKPLFNAGYALPPSSASILLNDDFALGAQLDFGTFKREEQGNDTAEDNFFGAAVFGRYYFLDLGQRFKTFTELGIGYGRTNDKLNDFKTNNFGAGLDLGINYFVTEKIALTFGLDDILSFNSSKVDASGAKASNEFNFGIGEVNNPFGGTANFGILFVL